MNLKFQYFLFLQYAVSDTSPYPNVYNRHVRIANLERRVLNEVLKGRSPLSIMQNVSVQPSIRGLHGG
jgi:hypothetical protein